jgi:outer membrane protein assembly factor BamA
VTNVSFGYDWRQSETISHQLFPIDINFVDIIPSPEFEEELEKEPNDRIRNQYTDHLIVALNYSFVYNNQKLSRFQNFFYYRGNLEPAGNLLQLFYSLFGTKKDTTDYYTILGIRYSQYFRTDHDLRYFYFLDKSNSLAMRFYFGIGIPYGNEVVLPLEKGFYGGGANGIRAWALRLLGPGSYNNPDDFFDRSGDLHLEANLEYRFTIYKFFKGAAFADVGNVWLLKENESYPGGEFKFNSFAREIAIGTGLGARFDFDFFVFRLDFAAKTRDPSFPAGQRWVIKDLQFRDIIVNFAIGYPF